MHNLLYHLTLECKLNSKNIGTYSLSTYCQLHYLISCLPNDKNKGRDKGISNYSDHNYTHTIVNNQCTIIQFTFQ